MIVSWNWLKRYLPLEMSDQELCERFSLSGLNHESTESVFGDLAIDLEVTSNRPDCLGHLGVAREASVLYDLPLTVPDPQPVAKGPAVSGLTDVDLQAPDLCPRYTARLIRGVKVGPSPDWLVDLLRNRSGDPDGFKSVNNIADITNFVMLECGQPLHAFDFDKLSGGKIVVRRAKAGEVLNAIDHRDYPLQEGMCVIADTQHPVALAGVMGGSSTEISDQTVNVLIESAEFLPLSIRDTSRQLKLASDSSYRFERTVDPEGIDWASRRCCELILEMAGGSLCEGVIDVGQTPESRQPVVLRLHQIARILGITVSTETVQRILTALGNEVTTGEDQLTVVPPSWRRDLTREVDLIEEVARIHGYDHIPEDQPVAMAVSSTPKIDQTAQRVRHALTACGLNEALSPTLVPPELSDLYSPWTAQPAMITSQPMSGVLDTKFWNAAGPVHCVRRSLIPSLLELRRLNEYRHGEAIELFEIAKAYLPAEKGGFPDEPTMVGICSGRDLLSVKSILQTMVDSLNHGSRLTVRGLNDGFFAPGRGIQLCLEDQVVGVMGETSRKTIKHLKMRRSCVVGEIQLQPLVQIMQIIPQAQRQSPYPAIERDLNFILDQAIRWAQLEEVVSRSGGELLEDVSYRETFVDESRDGAGKKRVLLAVTLRSREGTLTGQEADHVCQSIVTHCQSELGAKLVTA